MRDKKQAFVELIQRHRGESQAIDSKRIARYLEIEDSPGQPATRTLIKEAIREHWLPVGANENGYYWLTTTEELERYLKNLRGRIAGIAARIKAVEAYFYAHQAVPLGSEQCGQVYIDFQNYQEGASLR